MALSFVTALRNTLMDAVDTACNAGTGDALIRIYTSGGGIPASANVAVTDQTLLATLTMADPAFGASASGVITAGTIDPDTAADATGTATWFRIVDSDLNTVMDGTVGTSGADLNLNTVALTTGVNVEVTSFTITDGNA